MSKADKVTHGVESVGVDYGVCRYYANNKKLLVMVENKENAEQIAEILNADWHGKTLTMNDGWIPVQKCGYPKPDDEYKYFLTIDNKGEITIQEFLLSLDEEPQPYFSGMRNIVAWQPLPKPYKKGE